ncbi:Glycoside Hydrolase Family 5 protein [Gigaspora rosea]|uniref:Glycoside Hydrolase Family 5 protein n=1 Tax=Gigaspora rosea TaxID=44941 RepID=A0A397UWT5_9GLOM|nr:Glycoside Hydrolase Family 5 protein [Gigaspora rosea]
MDNESLWLEGKWIKDSTDRTLMFRGVNLSGSSKNPPNIPSHVSEGFFDHRNVSFVGRPFPLEEADQHLARLKHWGFNFLRFIVTWEALEHQGPGIYDFEFIDYIIKVLHKCKEYGFRCFMDPHQDVWSRFSGGSGAPGWTLDLAGLDMKKFAATDSAIVHNTYHDPKNFPKMVWSTNYYKLASATMFTLFFAGKLYAQKCIVDGVNIQDYLQSHYFNAYKTLASKICEAGLHDSLVIGYDSMNEPSWGFVSAKDLNHIPDHQEYKRGATPTPFQAMLLGEGNACTIQVWDITWYGFGVVGSEYVDPKGVTAWCENEPNNYPWNKSPEFPKGCIWAAHGVWDKETKTILCPDYFAKNPITGEPINWIQDCFKPFVTQYAEAIRSVHQDAIILVQPPILELPPNMIDDVNPLKRIMYSPHWYDGLTLTQKKFNWYNVDVLGIKRGRYPTHLNAIKIGNKAIRKNFADQIGLLISERVNYVGDCPCVIGEIGIPYDLDNRKAYENGDYTQQIKAMDANLQALESNLVNYTLWTYVPDNSNEWGDQWNGEDLSIYSAPTENTLEKIHSMMSTPDSHQILDIGGRALDSLLRPFPIKTNGEPLSLSFDPYKKVFKYRFKNDKFNPEKNTPTEIYLPRFHYPERDDFAITFLSGYADFDRDNQLLLYWHDLGDPADDRSDPNYGIHEIIVEFKKPLLGGEGIWDDCC